MNLTFNINKPILSVFDYLTDMQKFVSVHPVIHKMDRLSENSYLVHETLTLGIIPFSFTYPVTLEPDLHNKNIVIRATVMKLTKVEMSFTLFEEHGLTIINETITIRTPLPIKSLIEKVFRKQHSLLFENIEVQKDWC